MNKRPIIILTGPTAVGKTDLSVKLAEQIKGAIISADSMQVYKYMDIGSAKVTKEEMKGIDHYLIDVLDPREEFNVYVFQEMAKAALEKIYAKGQIPIVVGGTGFYIQALLYDIDFREQEPDQAYRQELEEYARKNGNESLHRMLEEIDPKSAETIHANNVKRVIRALEYYHLTGELMSRHNEEERKKESPYNFAYFVLNDQRDNLYKRIDKRVDIMMEKGLVEEVENLKSMGIDTTYTSMMGIGYKEVLKYIEGDYDLDTATRTVKQESRRYAKRQLTWFRREKDIIWLDKDKFSYDDNKVLEKIKEILGEKRIIDC